MTINGLKAGTHKNHAIFRSNSYEYEDSKSKDHYIRINKIPLTLKFNGLTQHNEKDIRDTPEVEIDAEFTVTGTDIWGNNIASYNFPHKVYCNNQQLTPNNNKYTYKFTKGGVYDFKVVSEDNEKYTTSEHHEKITINDSGATETNMTITFRNDAGTSEVYSSNRIHATASITPNELTNKILMKVYYNGGLKETIQGTEYHNTDNMKKGTYKVTAEYAGDKHNLPCRSEYSFNVQTDPTDFTNLNFTTTSGGGNVSTGDMVNVTGCLKSTKSNTPLKNTEYRLIIKKNGGIVSNNIYRTDNNGNINNSYKLMDNGSYEIEVKYDGDNQYYSPCSKRRSINCNKKTTTISGYKTSIQPTNMQRVWLRDGNDNPMQNQYVIFYVNGLYYNKLTNNEGMAELQINLPFNKDYEVLVSFNDEGEINACNSQKNTNLLPNPLYDSTVEAFTMTVEPPVKQTRNAPYLQGVSFNNQSRAWSSLNSALISQDNGNEYLACYNINGRTTSVNRPDSIHFKGFWFEIPEDATIYSITARFKTTYWRVNGGGTPFQPDGNLRDAYFDPAYCGIPAIPTSYVRGVTPFENMWTESKCELIAFGNNKQCTLTPSILNDPDFVFSIDFGQNKTDNIAHFGLVYFELSVEYFEHED